MSDSKPHLLVVEPGIVGHMSDHLGTIVQGWARANVPCHLSLAVHPKFAATFPDIAAALEDASRDDRRGTLVPVRENDVEPCLDPSPVRRGEALWSVMEGAIETDPSITHTYFAEMDSVQLILAKGTQPTNGSRVSGLLFRPSVHYRPLWGGAASLKERLRDVRKRWLYRFMLRNPSLETVHAFDDYFVDYARRCMKHGDKLSTIPEPYDVDFDAHAAAPDWLGACKADGRLVFLLFGSLTDRKGVMQTLDAVPLLGPDVAQRVAVVFAGKVHTSIREAFRERFAATTASCPQAALHLEDRFLPEDELHAAIAQSDVILAPYQRFVGSSGVLFLAAAAGKPLIAQSYGLVGARVREHHLGLAVDCNSPRAIADAMTQLVAQGASSACDPAAMRDLVAANTREKFAKCVFYSVTR